MKVLAGDVGGTRVRFAIIDAEGLRLRTKYEKALLSKDLASLEQALMQFLDSADESFESVCLGVAGPVLENRCVTTNLPWTLDANQIESVLNGRKVTLINDLAANALGIRALSESDFFVVNPGEPHPGGNACIIAAGTGLGEAGLYWDGAQHQPFPSEGGHCDFAPATDFDYRLLQFIAQRHGHVSWERIVSGVGIVSLFEFLCLENSESLPEWFLSEKTQGDPARAISTAALAKQHPIAEDTLRRFLLYYGAEAGNLALKTMASAGVFIGGGIAPQIIQLFHEPWFFQALCAKGRMQSLLQAMPVKVILNPRTALLGAAIRASSSLPDRKDLSPGNCSRQEIRKGMDM